jgi:hypothetical protein
MVMLFKLCRLLGKMAIVRAVIDTLLRKLNGC